MSAVVLKKLGTISPTLSEIIRACPLRAGLSRSREAAVHVLGTPKAWLGAAYHRVLERMSAVTYRPDTYDRTVVEVWDHAVAVQGLRAAGHPLDRRYGVPETWPGYHLTRAAVRIRAAEFQKTRGLDGVPSSVNAPGATSAAVIREHDFSACEGRLVGRPDVVKDDTIVDYKSGILFEFDESTHTEVVKASYVRQLRIYGYLVRQHLGRWVARGILIPLTGEGIQVALTPSECEREAMEAVALLDEYDARVGARAAPDVIATPQPTSCRWCPFKILCSAFWRVASPEWTGQLEGACVEGVIAEPVRAIQAGAALALSLDIQGGTERFRRAEIAPLNPSVHPVAATLSVGDRVRIVALRARPDERLVPTIRTILARIVDVPRVEFAL